MISWKCPLLLLPSLKFGDFANARPKYNMGWPFRPMASEPTILEPAAALEPSILVHWLSLYIGCVVCMLGIVVTRQARRGE